MKQWKRKLLFFLVLFVLVLSHIAAQSIDVNIRDLDKRVYYAGQGPIYIQITLTNKSAQTYRFKLADERAFSIDFDVRTLANKSLEPTEILIRKRSQNQQVFFREIAIEAGESFSFAEDLTEYTQLLESGSYVFQVKFYPELYRPGQNVTPLLSNRLSLTLYPAPLAEAGSPPPALDVETNAILVRQDLPPDRVIEYILTARQKGQWEKFFLYLDLESMISRDPVRKRSWLAESEEGRLRMLDQYRADLKSAVIDQDIATIPVEFTIERTSYGPSEGTVIVLEKFRLTTYTERKQYTYYLRRKDGIWMVVDYSVVNLGTE